MENVEIRKVTLAHVEQLQQIGRQDIHRNFQGNKYRRKYD